MNKFAYDLPKDLYKGMRLRPTMDSIANYIEKDPYRIKYPNRDATFYLNSPQFLNLLNDSGLDLQEQSEALSKQQLMQAQVTAAGRGGVVDSALGSSDSDVYMAGTGTLEQLNLQAREARQISERRRLLEQEQRRQEAERQYLEQLEAQRKMAEDARARTQQMAAASVAAGSGSHPVAQRAAERQPFIAVTPEMFQGFLEQMRRTSLLVPQVVPQPAYKGGDVPLTYPSTEAAARGQGIVPFSSTPQRLPPDTMTDAPPGGFSVKRPSADVQLPKAKARVEPVVEEVESPSGRQAANPVKKSATKRAEEREQAKELSKLLSDTKVYEAREIVSKFKEKFGDSQILVIGAGGAVSRPVAHTKRADIIKEYLERLSTRGQLESELKAIKEETRRRKSASS